MHGGGRKIREGVFFARNSEWIFCTIAILTLIAPVALFAQIAPGWYESNAPGDSLQVHISVPAGSVPRLDSAIFTGYLRVNSLDPPTYPCLMGHFDHHVIRTGGYFINDSCFKTPHYVENFLEAFVLEGCRISANEMSMRVYIATFGACPDTSDFILMTNSGVADVGGAYATPSAFRLYDNFPNPFNPVTHIRFDIPVSSIVSLKVYDVIGREVATLVEGKQLTGPYSAQFDASGLSSGVYFYRLRVGEFTAVKKLIVAK
ncbi:MAG TPA: T9SS type A sorting domain-containing protein [Bacteroidota bacterium]|jgi:hypothetical protein|nr:T9SS type A sorting domain-containing protein [Bacteroidota bacterium]